MIGISNLGIGVGAKPGLGVARAQRLLPGQRSAKGQQVTQAGVNLDVELGDFDAGGGGGRP